MMGGSHAPSSGWGGASLSNNIPSAVRIGSKRPAICRETTTEPMIGQCQGQLLARATARLTDWLREVIMQGCDWVAGTSLEQQPCVYHSGDCRKSARLQPAPSRLTSQSARFRCMAVTRVANERRRLRCLVPLLSAGVDRLEASQPYDVQNRWPSWKGEIDRLFLVIWNADVELGRSLKIDSNLGNASGRSRDRVEDKIRRVQRDATLRALECYRWVPRSLGLGVAELAPQAATASCRDLGPCS
ncbi:hypothetical protein BDW71DRAFT_30399 [Aspergillus fruticulosus]